MSSVSKVVLVIGGGFGGCAAITGLRKLNKTVEIVLVEPKEYCETCWAAYRSPFDEKTAKASLSPLAPYCETNKVKHIRTTVTSLTVDSAVLANGDTVKFDVCVVATGATTLWPAMGRGPTVVPDGTIATRLKQAKDEGDLILNSGSVLIVGGGLIGTELAGDVAGYAKKAGKVVTVTLVHSGAHLCSAEMSEYAGNMTQKQLEAAGVKVILNERATETETAGEYKLQSGEIVQGEKVIMTTGLSACNDFMKDIPEALNERSFVNTDECFRVAGTSGKIFSIGDCCITLPNSGAQLLENIKIIGSNVNATLTATNDSPDTIQLKKFKLGPEVYLATTGPNSGVMYTSKMTTARILPWLKNKTMFFFRVKSEFGLKPAA